MSSLIPLLRPLGMLSFFMAFASQAWPADLWDQQPGFYRGYPVDYASDGISTNGNQWQHQAMADNFSLTGATEVSSISFWGGNESEFPNDLSNVKYFDLVIYDQSFHSIYADQATVADLSPQFTGFGNFYGAKDFKLTYSKPIALAAGNYWLHVGSVNVDPQNDSFGWDASTADGTIGVNNFDGTGWRSYSYPGQPFYDLAFEIQGVPEPTTMAAFGLGLAALLRKRRR